MTDAISVEKLFKSYGEKQVLKGIDFKVNKGEIFALLGVNGAGKTTALECIEGLRRYESGKITVNGKPGIQLQSASLPEHIKSIEAVKLVANWNKAKPSEEMLKTLGIADIAKKQYIELSTGQKRRLHLALALISDPDIIFLDEPTAGLDVEGQISLHQEIRALKAKGKTIILASHDMAEVESLCDRIAILSDGNIAFIGSVSELSANMNKSHKIKIVTSSGEENMETENICDALLTRLSDCKARGVEVKDIQIDKDSFLEDFIAVARGNDR